MPAPRLGRPKGESPSDPIAGVFWVTLSMALLAGLAAFSRAVINAGVHPFEVVFLRNLFAVTMLLPLLAWRGWSLARSDQIGLYGWRVAISLFSMQAWFYAIALIPIGEVTAISFLSPLFGTLGAIFLLGERVRIRRWTALLVGFMGAMIILRPAGTPLGLGQICAILSAMTMGLTAILVKQLTANDDPDKIVFLTNALLLPLSLFPALFVWTLAVAARAAVPARDGDMRGAGARVAGARLCGNGCLARHDLRVLASAVRGRRSPISCSAKRSIAGPGSGRRSSSPPPSTSRGAKPGSSHAHACPPKRRTAEARTRIVEPRQRFRHLPPAGDFRNRIPAMRVDQSITPGA